MFLELQLHCEEECKQDNVKTKSPSPPQGSGYSGRGKTRSSLADIRLLCKAETSWNLLNILQGLIIKTFWEIEQSESKGRVFPRDGHFIANALPQN